MPADLLDYARITESLHNERTGRTNPTAMGGFFSLKFLTAKGSELYADFKLQMGKAPKFRGWSHTLHTIYFKWLLPSHGSVGFDVETAVLVYADKLREAGYEVETELMAEKVWPDTRYIKLKILNPYRTPEAIDGVEVTYELFLVIDEVIEPENLWDGACEELKALVRENVKNGVKQFEFNGATFDCSAFTEKNHKTVYYGSSGWDY
jgi:hypothetical protein